VGGINKSPLTPSHHALRAWAEGNGIGDKINSSREVFVATRNPFADLGFAGLLCGL